MGSKQDVDRIDLPYEEIEATVSFFLVVVNSSYFHTADVGKCFDIIKAKSGQVFIHLY